MKRYGFLCKLNWIGIFLLLLLASGCGLIRPPGTGDQPGGTGQKETESKGVIHFPEINKKEWVTTISKLCVQVDQSYTGVSGISEPIAEEIKTILERIGLETTIGESPECQANLKIQLTMTPVGEHVIGAGTCYFSSSAKGTATLSASGKKDLTLELVRNVSTGGGSGITFVYSCPSMEKANYAAAWGFAIVPMLSEWWGAPAMVSALRSENYTISNSATTKLGDMGPESSGVLPVLIEMLKDVDPNAREAAARTLGRFGPAARQAVPDLINLTSSPDSEIKRAAIVALGLIGDEQAIPVLIGLLDSTDNFIRQTAIEALGSMGKSAASATSELAKAALEKDYSISYAALDALEKIGPGAKEAVPALIEKLESGELEYKAADALESITGQEFGEDAAAWKVWWAANSSP